MLFLCDTTILFVTAKTRGIDAEREKEKCISTLNSSNYATIHQEKKLKDWPKSSKTTHFGQNDEYLTQFRLYEQFQEKPCAHEWDEAFAVVYSKTKIPHTISAHKLEQNDLPNPYFSRRFMAGNIRDGTGRYCFDMFGEKKIEDGTGRDSKIMKIVFAWMEQDGTVGVNFLDGTGRYSTMTFLFHAGTGR